MPEFYFFKFFLSNFLCYAVIEMDQEHLYWLGFSLLEGIGPKRFALLRDYFGSAKKAWQAPKPEFLALGLGPKLSERLVKARKKFNLNSVNLRLRENKVQPLFLDQKNYPENLKKIEGPPFVLYVKGEIDPEDNLALAVVGSRLMTGYGGQVTARLVTDLVGVGLTIVSGLARGVDTMAHRTALKAGGRTIGVLACGLDRCYPPENHWLVKEIVKGHGAVVSEYPLGVAPSARNFPARNRLIAGLSLGALVVEGSRKSGTLITARHAAEQGREVFAVPGPVTSRFSAGPAWLIKTGAKLVFDTHDILEELGIEGQGSQAGTKIPRSESAEEEILLSLLKDETKHIDELVRTSGLNTGKVASLLTLMEIKGKVKNLGGMNYTINN